jgi:hypothetical protein
VRLRNGASWQIRINRGGQIYDWALWIRAAERIDVPAGGPVPGPLDIDTPPDPSVEVDGLLASELADGWREWWVALVRLRQERKAFVDYGPLEFEGIASRPDLHRIVRRRWREAEEWHRARTADARNGAYRPSMVTNEVVSEIEAELGRPVRPFLLSFLLLPVVDDEIRPLPGDRYLVPEHVYDSAAWRDLLRPLVLSYGR